MFAVHGYWRILVKYNYVLPQFSACWNEKTATANDLSLAMKENYKKSIKKASNLSTGLIKRK